jgi:asparagine synthase (glutamine-hydrolysing)
MHKLADVIETDSAKGLYLSLMYHWKKPFETVKGTGQSPVTQHSSNGHFDRQSLYNFMMYSDSITYLPDDILVKVDRASMAVSLESRIPLLDHRIAEFAWTLPQQFKITGARGKHVLRELLNRYVPPRLIERPKMGFGLPVGEWLRGPLRDWAESLLDPALINRQGFFNVDPIRKKWNEHLQAKRQWTYELWIILMFQAWLETA